jgi:hypothetical protein
MGSNKRAARIIGDSKGRVNPENTLFDEQAQSFATVPVIPQRSCQTRQKILAPP